MGSFCLHSPSRGRPSTTRPLGASTAPPTTPTPQTQAQQVPKLSPPETYDGKEIGQKARQWITKVFAWARLSRTHFDREEDMVLYILSLLTGAAAAWGQPYMERILHNCPNKITTINEFGDAFAIAFDDPDATQAARRKLMHLNKKPPQQHIPQNSARRNQN